MLSIMGLLSTILTVKNAWKSLISDPFKQLDKLFAEEDYKDIAELSRFFFEGKVPYGTIVNVPVIFSEYSHTYRPMTYMPTIAGQSSASAQRLGTYIKGTLSTKIEMFHPPVEIIPEVSVDGRTYRLGFLYPLDFNGFNYEPAFGSVEEAVEQGLPYFHVPESAKPVPLLYRRDASLISGNSYIIKARVAELPVVHWETIRGNLGNWSDIIYGRAFDLTSIRKSLCLLIDEAPTNAKDLFGHDLSCLPVHLFVEGHFEGLHKDEAKLFETICNCIPNIPSDGINRVPIHHFNYKGYEDFRSCVTTGNVRIVLRKPSVVGFYTMADIASSDNYRSTVTELKDVIRRLDRNMQNATAYKVKYHVDFVSDRRLIDLLGLIRVLTSQDLKEIFEKSPELGDIKKWLVGK